MRYAGHGNGKTRHIKHRGQKRKLTTPCVKFYVVLEREHLLEGSICIILSSFDLYFLIKVSF